MLRRLSSAMTSFAEHYRRFLALSWQVSWPMIIVMVFEFLIQLTDVWIAGRYGREYQAAVGLVSQVYFIFIVTANAVTVGTVAVVARLSSSPEATQAEVDGAISSVLRAVALVGLALALAGALLAPSILALLTPYARVRELGAPLFRVYALGMAFHYLLITTNGVLRSLRRVKTSMGTMALACVVNVGVNLLFFFLTDLKELGIGLSTALAVTVAAVVNLFHLRGHLARHPHFSLDIVKRVAATGWPAGLLQIAWQLGGTALFAIIGALPGRDVTILAAYTAGLRVESAIFLPAFAFNMANAVVVGNLLGEKRPDEAFRAGLVTAGLAAAFVSLMTVVVVANGAPLFDAVAGTPAVARESLRYLHVVMWSEPFMAWAVTLSGGANGAGDTRGVMLIVASSAWLVRIPLAWFLGIYLDLGPLAVWWSMNASILVHALFITRRWLRRRWTAIGA